MDFSIVLGATGVIGETLACTLAKRGENLFISGRTLEKLTVLKSKLLDINKNLKIELCACNLEDFESVQNLINEFLKLNAKVSAFYYVSGIDTQKAFINYDYKQIVSQSRVNYESCIVLTNFALKNMANSLKIMVVSSMCGLLPMPYYAEYSSTKGALINFYTALRYELKNKNVKISILAPGSVPTRQDIIEDIKRQGLQGKLSSKSPQFVIEKGLKALEKNKRICIPGFYNKIVNLFNKITPNFIKLKIIKNRFSKKSKDAFK